MGDPDFADAIALLRGDHRTLENLFAAFASSRNAHRRHRLAGRIRVEAHIHALIEEEVFHPALQGFVAQGELDRARALLGQTWALVETLEDEAESGDTAIARLAELMGREVDEQEDTPRGLFALCREAKLDLIGLRDRLLARKEELTALAETGALPRAEAHLPHPV